MVEKNGSKGRKERKQRMEGRIKGGKNLTEEGRKGSSGKQQVRLLEVIRSAKD